MVTALSTLLELILKKLPGELRRKIYRNLTDIGENWQRHPLMLDQGQMGKEFGHELSKSGTLCVPLDRVVLLIRSFFGSGHTVPMVILDIGAVDNHPGGRTFSFDLQPALREIRSRPGLKWQLYCPGVEQSLLDYIRDDLNDRVK